MIFFGRVALSGSESFGAGIRQLAIADRIKFIVEKFLMHDSIRMSCILLF
jgi:hypothetical protein